MKQTPCVRLSTNQLASELERRHEWLSKNGQDTVEGQAAACLRAQRHDLAVARELLDLYRDALMGQQGSA
jgi:hypothetical protein